ncbi:MAG: HepT-like ribonuclease domain-containing protein, partial [Candidatus Dormibacteria bacterium]
MRSEDRLISRLRDVLQYGERAKNTVRGRRLEEMEPVEIDVLCYLVLIVSEATIQALTLDETLVERHPEIPWREIRATGNRLRHGYASIDHQVVHNVVDKGHIDQSLRLARTELERRAPEDVPCIEIRAVDARSMAITAFAD